MPLKAEVLALLSAEIVVRMRIRVGVLPMAHTPISVPMEPTLGV